MVSRQAARHPSIRAPANQFVAHSRGRGVQSGALVGIQHSSAIALEDAFSRKRVHTSPKDETLLLQPKEIPRPLTSGTVALPEPQVDMGLVWRLVGRKARIAVDGKDRTVDFRLGMKVWPQARQELGHREHKPPRW